ncbi:MAG: KEOPS complex subunit Pcc1 [Candidatus Thorarchaeota archaeon]
MFAQIVLDFESEAIAERMLSTITPDNTPLPSGLEIECTVQNKSLSIEIHSKRSLESLGSTLEDIMSAIDLSMRTSDTLEMQ